jgi:putative lipoprotein
MHYSVSLMLAADGYTVASAATERPARRALWGSAFSLSAGLAKEIRDEAIGRTFSWRDLTWDALGAATGTTVAWLIDRYLLTSPRRAP